MSLWGYQHQRLIPDDHTLQLRICGAAVKHEADINLSIPDFGHQVRLLLGLQMDVQPWKRRPQLLQKRRQVKGRK
ncbi:hypothetical protein D3C81_1811280 [compost metagenome]